MLLASFQNVTKRYSVETILKGASFQISSGQKLGLIGPNGSGKTTILRILLGQEQPSEGHSILARDIKVGYVPQDVEYEDSDTVLGENIMPQYGLLKNAGTNSKIRGNALPS